MFLLLFLHSAHSDIIWFESTQFNRGSGVAPDESPQQMVWLSAYGLDQSEVSIAEFEQFRAQGWSNDHFWHESASEWRKKNPEGAGVNRAAGRSDTHPVVAVTWFEADAYCKYKGGQLPTEAQWEHAACGQSPSGTKTRFPWGESEDVEAVWYSGGKYGHLQSVLTKPAAEATKEQQTAAGLKHTVGNVWEWTADWYHSQTYSIEAQTGSKIKDPAGPDDGTWKTLRGGSFMNLPSYCSCTHREPAKTNRVAYTVGFRCAYPASMRPQ